MFIVLTRYIFWQSAGPFLMATGVLTGIIWLTQALKMLDLLITQGQTLVTFFQLSLLALPSAVNTVLPIALFCALLYKLNNLITDSLLVLMFSAGVSRWAVALPVMMLAAVTVVIVLVLNLYLMPAGMRELRAKLFEIRGDIATSLVREGAFTNPVSGLTVYVRSRTPEGGIRGILVHDERVPGLPVTYMAETGELVRSPEGARLVMYNGNIERVSRVANKNQSLVSLLYFDKYTYDLSQYGTSQPVTEYEARERYMGELFSPASNDIYGQQFKQRLRAEGHDRLVAALYPIMFAMIALACLLPAPFNRRGYTMRIAIGATAAVIARVIGFGLINVAASQPAAIPLIYLLPLAVCAISAAIIAGTKFDALWRQIAAWADRLPLVGGAR
ncbi:MAG: LptF/LptG family permease [Parvibaculum sp.]|uniref:LptF/LptG family permease n=1 Tax=Parvibaculum sp. TaxID=2024848 RepID=UPI0025D55BEE|nr:LptF/LptG family permease [Parvibaculum sp.]MCE9648285.1 LptF/LptG family permease [Parvibaculum sp.]